MPLLERAPQARGAPGDAKERNDFVGCQSNAFPLAHNVAADAQTEDLADAFTS
jgi:hypothetical protein